MIVCFVILIRLMPQPWRGLLDAGVVVGLSLGVLSIFYFICLARTKPDAIPITAEVPGDNWHLQSSQGKLS